MNSKEEILYICSNNKKNLILDELSKIKNLYNVKFMTLDEFKDEYFYKYDVNIYPYMMEKYNISFNVCKEYLDNMYYIDINKNYTSSKIMNLKNIKEDLINNNLFIFNKCFKSYLKTKKIIVTYEIIDPCLKNVLDSYNTTYLKNTCEDKALEVLEFNDIEEEVNNTIIKIIDLLNHGISLNNIYITNIDKEYYYTLKRLFNLYNIPIELGEKVSLNSVLFIKKYFITKKMPDITVDNKNIVESFTKLLNKYVGIEDSKYYKSIIKEELKNTYVKNSKLKDSIKVVDFDNLEVSDNDYVFLLGFNEGVLPKIYKDEDYFSDIEKLELGIMDSKEKNALGKDIVYNKIKSISHLVMSYKKHGFSEEYYSSNMINDYDIKVVNNRNLLLTVSDNYNKRYASILLDNYNKYRIFDDNLKILLNKYSLSYNTYNHKFTGISKDSYLDYINKPLKLFYTSMNSYNLCPFKYYINYVLKIDPYEDTFAAFIGNLYHKLFSLCFYDGFDFEKSFDEYIKDKVLEPKEVFLLKRLKKELEIIIDVLKEQKMYTDFKEAFYEKELEVTFDNFDVDVIFKGIIDKIMYYQVMNDTYYAVVDYKTGSFEASLNNLKYGLDSQLSSYIYLIEKSNLFSNPIFTGCYFQKTMIGNINKTKNKTVNDIIFNKLKLTGYSTSDERVLSYFDHNYTKSTVINGMSVTDKGFSRYAKVLSGDDVSNLISYTDKVIKDTASNILDAKFDISPKVIDGKEKACKYCKYKDICFKDINDNVELEKVSDLSFLGGE